MMPAAWEPHADPSALAALEKACAAHGLAATRDRPLGRGTTLGVGGGAALFVDLPDADAVVAFARLLDRTSADELPVFVLGKGSNTLIADAGVDTVVIKLGAGLKWLRRDGPVAAAGAGEAMPALAAWVAKEGSPASSSQPGYLRPSAAPCV